MSDQISAAQAHARLIANAWHDDKVMKDLHSGDQAKIRKHFKNAGIKVPKNVPVHVHRQTDKDVHVILPPAPSVHVRDLAAGGGSAPLTVTGTAPLTVTGGPLCHHAPPPPTSTWPR